MNPRRERYRAIVETLSVHGFGFAAGAVGLAGRPPFRHGLPGHEQGRVYAQPEHLRLALEELGPTFVKLGQILSTRPDLLPPEYVAELAKLQDSVAPAPSRAMLDVVADEPGESTRSSTWRSSRTSPCGPAAARRSLANTTSSGSPGSSR